MPRQPVSPVRYTPPAGHPFDVELIEAADLRARVAQEEGRGVERVDFSCLVLVTGGSYEHTVDFETHGCTAGSCLIVQPGQVHEFGPPTDWTGWMLVFKSDLLDPHGESLPSRVQLDARDAEAMAELFERMSTDAASRYSADSLDELLRGQVRLALTRLVLAAGAGEGQESRGREEGVLERFREFRLAVDREFARWHHVSDYAKHLGCSPKSLNRASREVADVSAKSVIVDRIVLEAKRLLAHTSLPVSAIGDQLGFDEPTNFVKFFRRVTGATPGTFRSTTA